MSQKVLKREKLRDAQVKLINKQIDLTLSRLNKSVSILNKEFPGLSAFTLENHLSKCNNHEKISTMVECWVYKGVTLKKSNDSCKDWINNHKWHMFLQWTMMYILDAIRAFLLQADSCVVNEQQMPSVLRQIVLRFDGKYPIAHQSPPVPLFPIQKMFAHSPSKGDPSTSALGKIWGKPSQVWNDLRQLYNYLVSDVTAGQQLSLLKQFKKTGVEKSAKNKGKLQTVNRAYEFGYKYPKWMLLTIGSDENVSGISVNVSENGGTDENDQDDENNDTDTDLVMNENSSNSSNDSFVKNEISNFKDELSATSSFSYCDSLTFDNSSIGNLSSSFPDYSTIKLEDNMEGMCSFNDNDMITEDIDLYPPSLAHLRAFPNNNFDSISFMDGCGSSNNSWCSPSSTILSIHSNNNSIISHDDESMSAESPQSWQSQSQSFVQPTMQHVQYQQPILLPQPQVQVQLQAAQVQPQMQCYQQQQPRQQPRQQQQEIFYPELDTPLPKWSMNPFDSNLMQNSMNMNVNVNANNTVDKPFYEDQSVLWCNNNNNNNGYGGTMCMDSTPNVGNVNMQTFMIPLPMNGTIGGLAPVYNNNNNNNNQNQSIAMASTQFCDNSMVQSTFFVPPPMPPSTSNIMTATMDYTLDTDTLMKF